LEQLAGEVDGPLVGAHAAHARALVDRDLDRMNAVVDRYEELDVLWFAAEAAAELADLLRAGSQARLASAAAQRSAGFVRRLGELRTPPLARGSGVEPLTPREREVALLAAGGRSSAQIGEHLHLSTRTVDTHLARVYRKLGIAGRAELDAALASQR
jgi:DNA-binding CsgD family transcriptional regulator